MATLKTTAPKIAGEAAYTPEEYRQAKELYEPDAQRVEFQQAELGSLREQERQAKELFSRAKSEQETEVRKAGVRATEDYVKDVEKQQEKYREQISANPLPTHRPTQEDLSTYAQMGSLMMTMGLMLGAGGKANAKLGLDAMTGMMNGWRRGRQDLWKQEAVNFEKAFNKIKADREAIYKNLQEGMKLASTNYAAAKEKFETAAFISGQNSIVAHGIRTGNLQSVIKNLEDTNRVQNDLQDKIRSTAMGLAARRERRQEAEKQRAFQEKVAQLRTGNLGATEKKELRGYVNLTGEMERLKSTFKPEYADFVIDAAGKWKSLFDARLKDNPDMANWWRAYENVAMPERHSMFGATLTGGEREAWRAASIGPGNSIREIGTWFDERIRSLNNRIDGFERTNDKRNRAVTSDPLGILSE
jgi:hypothetical protein